MPDAVHLQFAVDSQARDPMQLRLAVNISLHSPAGSSGSGSSSGGSGASRAQEQQRQWMDVVLELDGTRYRLALCRAARLVLPQQVAPLLPAALQQQQLGGSCAAAGNGQQPGGGAFLALAPPSSLPFLTLVFPHACLNMYPLGWKAAAAHLNKVCSVSLTRGC